MSVYLWLLLFPVLCGQFFFCFFVVVFFLGGGGGGGGGYLSL